ncbi:hypothetical protein PG996_011007 [Apiospora saccharicola]|uniref:Uncharacterized protein n=1 Tax=Apiospora saccharicola TaxID=335842 RepID=A0ABR1UDT7_9PEZI
MPRVKEEMKMAPRAVRVFVHDHSKRQEPEHAASLGRYRMNMMENDTYADAGLRALHRFRKDNPEQGRRVEVEAIMDKDYWVCSLSESLETLQDGEPLHVFLTEPLPASSQEAPKTPAAKAKTKTQSQKGPATPNVPRSAKGTTSSNADHQTPTSNRSRRSSTNAKEVMAAPTPQIEISSDSGNTNHSSSEDTDCIFMGQTPDRTQKPPLTPKLGGKPSQTPSRTPISAVQKQVSSSLPTDRTPVPAVKKLPPGHKHSVQPQEPKKPETSLPPNSFKSPRRTLSSSQNQQEPASSLQTATSTKADALPAKTDSKTPKSQPATLRSSTSSSKARNAQKDVYDVPSDTDEAEFFTPIITPQQNKNLRARLRALQDDVVPSSPLPQKTADEQTTSSRKPQSAPKAKVTVIRDSEDSASEESDDEMRIVAKTPDSYTLRNTRGTHSVSRRKGHSSQLEASEPPSSSVAAFPGSSPCARSSNRKSADLIERLDERNKAAKKRQEEEEAAAAAEEAAEKEKAEAEARRKRISSREAIDQVKKMTSRKVEPKTLIEEIPDSFFEDTDLSDDHLGDDIIKGPSQSRSSFPTATPKDGTPRFAAKRRHPTPTTSFTPINTLYPKQHGQQNLGNATAKTFGLNYPKHFRDRFSDAEQSDEDDAASVGSEEERFWRGEVLDDEDGLPKAYKEYAWKYNTQFVSLGDRGYTYVGDGPWEGLILNGRHRGKYVFGCEPPNHEQIAEEEKNAEPRSQPSNFDESEADDNEDDAAQVELPPCSLPQTTQNSTTPTSRRQTAQDAKASDESDLRSAASETSSVMIRKQLEAECPPSNQQLGIIMSSSPSNTPTGRSKVAPTPSASAGRFDGDSPGLLEDDSEDTPKPISKLVVNNSGLSEGRKATIKKVTFSDQVEVGDDREPILSPKPPAEVISESSDAPEDDEKADETILPPKPLAEITGSEASEDEDANEDSQASRVSALKYVLQESPHWLNNLTKTNQTQGSCKGLEQDDSLTSSSSPNRQRQKSEPPSSSAPPRFRSYTPIPPPVIPTFTAATPSRPAIQDRKISNDISSQRKRLASEPPKYATQVPTTAFKSFTPVPPPSIPAYPRSTLARPKPSVDSSPSQTSSSAAQKQPSAPETPQKCRENLWDSVLTSSSALAVTPSSKSSSQKHRRRDSESKHSKEPSEEPSPSRKKHKTKHHKKDKSVRKSRHEEQQDEYGHDEVIGVKTGSRDDASDADSIITVLKHARKDDERKKKKRKHRHSKTLGGSTAPREAAQADADEDSSHTTLKSSRKHRKSLDLDYTPSGKKRKHSHGSHDAVVPATTAVIPTRAMSPTTLPPPPTTAKREASLSKPHAVVIGGSRTSTRGASRPRRNQTRYQ